MDNRIVWESDWDGSVSSQFANPIEQTGTEYYRFSIRFELSADKDTTLQEILDAFANRVDWLVLVYHECYHDETGGCSWEERWEYTANNQNIPQDASNSIPEAPTTINATASN